VLLEDDLLRLQGTWEATTSVLGLANRIARSVGVGVRMGVRVWGWVRGWG
jgi:hypothetical protein